jgi:hypothetical protein
MSTDEPPSRNPDDDSRIVPHAKLMAIIIFIGVIGRMLLDW